MKKLSYYLSATVVALTALVGCNQNPVEPEVKDDVYPRKLLVEHFTGQACGYCPMGMTYIEQFIKAQGEENVIWLSNHSGYSDDLFTISDSKKLATKFKVNGAPSVMLNREKQSYRDEDSGRKVQNTVFHPYYLTSLTGLDLTAPASVIVENTYDDATRKLAVTVSGTTAADVDTLFIVVAVKESGLHGMQADYYNTWEGWEDFVHNHAVRAYLTDITGDLQEVTSRRYSYSVECDLDKSWVADNCSVVAYLINGEGTVINAEQAPVVSGTKGGEDIKGGGVKEVAVPDTYPEYEAVPQAATDIEFDEVMFYPIQRVANGYLYQLVAYPSETTVDSKIPVYFAEIILAEQVGALPDGTYPFNDSGEAGTAVAGVRDEKNHEIDGSMFFLADASYFAQGYLVGDYWLLTDGSIVIDTEDNTSKIDITATTLIGSNLKASYAQPIESEVAAKAPIKFLRKK